MRLLCLSNCCGAANRKLQRCITVRISTAKGDGCPSPFVQSAEKSLMVFLHAMPLRNLSPAGWMTASSEKDLLQNIF